MLSFVLRDKVIKLGNLHVLNRCQLLSVALCISLFQQRQTSCNFLLYLVYLLWVERIMITHANHFIINREESSESNSLASW